MQLKHLFGAALAAGGVLAQEDSDSPMMMNLTALLSGTDSLSTLNSLVGMFPDLVSQLGSAQNITVLAPSNDAFEQLGLGDDPDEDLVMALLTYHVLMGNFTSDMITETPAFIPTMLNNSEYSTVSGGQVVEAMAMDDEVMIFSGLKNNATVQQADVMFTGGVAHVIDTVLSIPGNVTSVAQDANLTALLGAVTQAEVGEALLSAEDVTIFAPNNDAFESIASALPSLTMDQLAGILQYHVVGGTIAYSSTLANGTVPSLAGEDITISITDDGVYVNSAKVVQPDVLLANGVLHVIDSVLSPNSTGTPSNSSMSAYPGASSGSLPFTSDVPTPTSSNPAQTTADDTTPATTNEGNIGDNPNATGDDSEGSSSSTEGAAPRITGAVGAAALFGGAAIVAGW